MGASSSFLPYAKSILVMEEYLPVRHSPEATPLSQERAPWCAPPDRRRMCAEVLDPSFSDARGHRRAFRVKPLRGEPGILEYGNQQVDLRALAALAVPARVHAVGLLLAAEGGRTAEDEGWRPGGEEDPAAWVGQDRLAAVEGDMVHFLASPRWMDLRLALDRFPRWAARDLPSGRGV